MITFSKKQTRELDQRSLKKFLSKAKISLQIRTKEYYSDHFIEILYEKATINAEAAGDRSEIAVFYFMYLIDVLGDNFGEERKYDLLNRIIYEGKIGSIRDRLSVACDLTRNVFHYRG